MPAGATRIPLNLFGIPFGLAGLAGAWRFAAGDDQAPAWIGDALIALSALTWLIVLGVYLRYALGARGRLAADLVDPAAGPFASLIVIAPMLIAVQGIVPHAFDAGRVVVDVFLVLTLLLGGWFTGQWIYGPLELNKLHPGYFLPTAAGGFIASASAAAVGQQRLGELMLGLGLVCWLMLGSMILARLFFAPPLPAPLVPALAIEVAPAAVAGLAYFSLNGNAIDPFVAGLSGYGLLMVLAQIRLVPWFLRLSFAPGFWAFTFSWAAVVTVALHWVLELRPTGYRVYSYLLLAAITILIGAIAVRTIIAIARGELLPKAPAPVPAAVPATSD